MSSPVNYDQFSNEELQSMVLNATATLIMRKLTTPAISDEDKAKQQEIMGTMMGAISRQNALIDACI